MTTLVLERFAYCPWGTFGRIQLPDGSYVWTAEQEWSGNIVGKSCIPDGLYDVKPDRYNRGGYDALEIQDVPGRSEILIHKGNKPSDVQGCIAVGANPQSFQKGEWAVGNSAADENGGFTRLMAAVGSTGCRLHIVSRCGTTPTTIWEDQ